MRFGGAVLKDGKGNQLSPLKGDWTGELTTGKAPLIILEKDDAKASAKPEGKHTKEESASLTAPGRTQRIIRVTKASFTTARKTYVPVKAFRPQPVTSIDAQISGPAKPIDAKVVITLTEKFDGDEGLLAYTGRTVYSKTVETDKDGKYRIEIPEPFLEKPGLHVAVTVSRNGYLHRTVGPIPVSDFDERRTGDKERNLLFRSMQRSALKNTRLRKGRRLNGTLNKADGTPAAGASIRIATKYQPYSWKFHSPDDYSCTAVATADEEGRFSVLVDTRATMLARLPGHAPLIIDNLSKDVSTFQLPQPITATGTVRTFDGKPISLAVVRVQRDFDWNEFDMPLSYSESIAADAFGNFQLPPLPVDKYKLTVSSRAISGDDAEKLNQRTAEHEPTVFASEAKFKTESLPAEIIIPVKKVEFFENNEAPAVELKATETSTVSVNVDSVDITREENKIRIEGLFRGEKWHGKLTTVSDGETVSLEVPTGLQQARIEAGAAMVKMPGDDQYRIGYAIHLEKIDGDRDGYSIRLPQMAKFEVTVQLPPIPGARGVHIRYRAEYLNEGYHSRQPGLKKLFAANSRQSGNTRFEAPVFPDQPFQLSILMDDVDEPLHSQKLTLKPGEFRKLEVDLSGI